jgi:hypothetical protein
MRAVRENTIGMPSLPGQRRKPSDMIEQSRIISLFYLFKPLIPRRMQIHLRRRIVAKKRRTSSRTWPIDVAAATPVNNWSGWPDQKKFAVILTHDVDTPRGHTRCLQLADLEKNLGFRSAFYFVPRRYDVSLGLREYLLSGGFEIGVHGLYHDGLLYKSREIFRERALHINRYLKEWQAVGFRSPSMHHNLDWLHDLEVEYDASTFDTDPFEPQPDGVRTIFPFWVNGETTRGGYVELPYTLAQDFTLFILMQNRNIDMWKHKLDWIADQGGMALILTHPDYMNFDGSAPGFEEYPSRLYEDLLLYIKDRYRNEYWHALPKEVARFWTACVVDKR